MGTEEASVTTLQHLLLAELREGNPKQQQHKTEWNQTKPLFACSVADSQCKTDYQASNAENQTKQNTDNA